MTLAETWSEEIQIARAAAIRDDGVFDREKQSPGYIYFSILRRSERLAEAYSVLDGGSDVNGRLRIGLARGGGDTFHIPTLMMRRCADDGVEGGRQRAHDLIGFLVAGNADHKNPSLRAINRLQAGERLPDGVGGMADVDRGERVLPDDLEAARPARIAQARSHRPFHFSRGFGQAPALQPKQKQRSRDRRIVELKRAAQAGFERSKFVNPELEVETLAQGRDGFA